MDYGSISECEIHCTCSQTHSVSKGGHSENNQAFDNFENLGANIKLLEMLFARGM